MKKEALSIVIIKILLAILLFTGMGTIIIGGGYIIGEYSKNGINDQITKLVNQEENYYDVLKKKCNSDDCCLSSLNIMRQGNYKEADKNGNCLDGFEMNMQKCITSYQWCESIKEVEWESCDEDNDCEVRFLHCDCRYHCVNKNAETDDCAVACGEMGSIISECICENNKCVEKKSDTSDWQTYRNEELRLEFQYPDKMGNIEISSTKSRIVLSDLMHFESSVYRDPVAYIFIHNYDSKQFSSLEGYLFEGRGWDDSQAHSKLISTREVFNSNDLKFFEIVTELSGDRQIATPFKRKLYYIEYRESENNEFIKIAEISDDKFIGIVDTFKFIEK